MNAVEFEQAVNAGARRVDAVMGGDTGHRRHDRNDAVAVFAGTDLPGQTVLAWLVSEINAQMPLVEEIGIVGVLQGLGLNTFLIGFECGRRSK